MRVHWSERARRQVVEIFEYVVRDRPQAAEALLDRLIERIDLLSELPEQGRLWGEGVRPDLREVVFEPYRIVYRVGSNELSVLSVRHTRMEAEESP